MLKAECAEFFEVHRPKINPGVLPHRLLHREAAPGAGEVQVVPGKRDGRVPVHLLREEREDLLGEVHHVVVVPVGLVDLHHRELGVVVGVDVLVPEVLCDLKDLLETADDKALEVEFRRDPEVEFLVEGVVVGGERSGVCAAVDRLQGGCLELQVVPVEEELPEKGYDPAPCPEGLAALLVHDQVDVTLPVPGFDVPEAVELLRERADRLRQELEPVDPDGDLAHLRPEDVADDADDIPGVDVLAEEVELFFAEVVLPEVYLDPAGRVPHIRKDRLAVLADDVDPACGADFFLTLIVSDPGEPLLDLLDGIPAVEGVRVDRHPALAQFLYFVDLCRIKTGMIHIVHCVNRPIRPAAGLRVLSPAFAAFPGQPAAILLVNPTYTSPLVLLTFEEGGDGGSGSISCRF